MLNNIENNIEYLSHDNRGYKNQFLIFVNARNTHTGDTRHTWGIADDYSDESIYWIMHNGQNCGRADNGRYLIR